MDIENVNIFGTSCNRCRRTAIQKQMGERPRTFNEDEVIHEARRCLYCSEANCVAGCPTQLDVRRMVHAAGEGNFYEAARVALTANPLALSCGKLCGAENYCKSTCNLGKTRGGPIAINEIQAYALERFREYRISPTVGKDVPKIPKRVAVVGGGPAGLAAAAFLARLNFEKIDLFEKEGHLGGAVLREVPYFRISKADTEFEAGLVQSYPNVSVHLNTPVDPERLEALRKEYDAVFVGVGRTRVVNFEGAVSARDFCWDINRQFKLQEAGFTSRYADLSGKRVLVLGSGDVAVDCAEIAQARGAAHVALLMRKDIQSAKCQKQSMLDVVERNIEVIPSLLPLRLEAPSGRGDGCAAGVWCKDLIRPENGERLIPCDLVVCAFGTARALDAVIGDWMKDAAVDEQTGCVSSQGKPTNIYCGGDCSNGLSIVEAVNDAKNAVAAIHRAVCGGASNVGIPRLTTDVEEVDLTVEMDGVKYPNPLGISSAPISGTYEHIRRSFLAGFGFAVTKTYPLEKDIQRNNHVRIVKVYDSQESTSYNNIVMISEHSHLYWCDTIRKLKAEFPRKVVIASIMCMDNEADWRELATLSEAAGADALELNFSCPNECHGNDGELASHEGGFKSKNAMAMAIGVSPSAIERCTRYVVSAVKIPVYPKLTPNVTNIEELAAAALQGGAKGISLINTVVGISQITLSGYPWPQVGLNRATISGGLSGDLVRPIAIRHIAQCINHNKELAGHVLGIGGARSSDTCMQLIYAGASVVQLCSAVQKYSYDIVDEMLSGLRFILYCWSRPDLRAFLDSRGPNGMLPHASKTAFWTESSKPDHPIPTLADIRGKALAHIGEREILQGPEKWRVRADIDPIKCIGCGSCALSCRDNATAAIALTTTDKGKAVFAVDPTKCFGCALCSSVCPVRAISYVSIKGLSELSPDEAGSVPTGF